MKKIRLVSFLMFALMLGMIFQYQPATSRAAGAPAGNTNSPADNSNCTSCHGGTAASALTGIITSNVPPAGYTAGTVYTITASVGDSSLSRFGFQISPQNNAGTLLGGLTITNATQTQIVSTKYVTHKSAGTTTTPNHSKSWSFNWTAPAAGTGSVTFYGSFLYTNSSNSSSGDVTRTSTLVIPEAVVTPAPTVSIAITNGVNPTCSGSNVTFTATPTNGGSSPTYQWKINGNNAGTGVSFSTAALTNGQIVTCTITATGGATATSNGIVMTVNPILAPSVTITATSATTLCAGQPFSFSASPTNGGSSPTYQWKVNGNNAATGSGFSSNLSNSNVVTCVMTSNANCASPTTATSNSIQVTVTPLVTPSVSIAATSATTLCSGQIFSFSASPTNGGSSPTYQWKVNGNNTVTGSIFSSALNNSDAVTCVLTSNAACASPTAVTSNSIPVTVTPLVTPTVAITATSATTLCSGQTFSFSASPTNAGGSPTYQWKVNGNNAATGSIFSSALNNNDAVTCIMTSNSNCITSSTATSNSINVLVNPLVIPSISISTPSTNICAGQSVSFTSSITNGGASPAYQWKVNGNNAGTSSSFSQVLNNSDAVTCVLTSNAGCVTTTTATSNSIAITTSASVVPVVSIAADNASACSGIIVNLTATPANGGSAPTYQWKVNGANAAAGATFSSIFSNGDTVNCLMTSNSTCASVPTATSNEIVITVNPLPTVSVSPNGNVAVCAGDSVQLTVTGGTSFAWSNNAAGSSVWVNQQGSYSVTATDDNSCSAVSSPVNLTVNALPTATIIQNGNTLTASAASSYQWFLNGSIISNQINQVYTASQTGNYSVRVTDNSGCSAVSSELNVIISSIDEADVFADVKIYPVPNNGSFVIESLPTSYVELSVTDMYGRLVFLKEEISSRESVAIESLVPQVYFVTLRSENKMKVFKMEVR
jgi:hypothetical protein